MIELPTVSLGAAAIVISLWSVLQSHRSARRQSELQQRLLHLEEAAARSRSTAEQSAKLRAVLDRSGICPALLVINEGAAEGRNISVKIDGTQILEHYLVPGGQEEVRQLGPGAEAR